MWKAGHSLLKAKMKETGALLGGEMSGHIFFKERYFGFDDAIYAGARLLEILGRTGRTRRPSCSPTCRRRTTTPGDPRRLPRRRQVRASPTACATASAPTGRDIIDVDGVRVRFPHGWGLLRASNTQPVLVMRFEAETPAQLAEYRRTVEAAVADARRGARLRVTEARRAGLGDRPRSARRRVVTAECARSGGTFRSEPH